MAWLPSRMVTSEIYSFWSVMGASSGGGLQSRLGQLFGTGLGRGRHDVEIAGIGRQVVGGAFDFQIDRRLEAADPAHAGHVERRVRGNFLELHLLFQAV